MPRSTTPLAPHPAAPRPAPRRRRPLPLGLLGLVCAALLLAPLVPPGAAAEAPADTNRRPGLRVRFAAIHGQSGLTGSAFLLFSSRRISLDAPASACPGAHVVRAEARGSRGLVRKVELTLHMRRGGDLAVQAAGCPRAELRAELEDGTVLSGGEGTVTLDDANPTSGGAVTGSYTWTTTRAGAPFPMRGAFHLTLP